MSTDDVALDTNRQAVEPDIGPEPAWLVDQDDDATEVIEGTARVKDTGTVDIDLIETVEKDIQRFSMVERMHPWLRSVIPFLLLMITGGIAWLGTGQTFNEITTWESLGLKQPGLFPARWTMVLWWITLPLMAIFLIYATLPKGRLVTHIKTTGPLIELALISTSFWLLAQHWQLHIAAFISICIALVATMVNYSLVAFSRTLNTNRQRVFAVVPLSAALAHGVMLVTISGQNAIGIPFGTRAFSIVFMFVLLLVAAMFAFFLRDGAFAAILSIWFAGVAHQQWHSDLVVSLIAGVTTVFTVVLGVMGMLLAMESSRPSFTVDLGSGRNRTSFFRKSKNASSSDLP